MKTKTMPWTLPLGRIAGIQLRVHATFVLLLIWVAFTQSRSGASLNMIAVSLLFVILVFGCIVLHELGHALMALRFGIKTQDIILLPIGGMARLERMPKEPAKELAIALAGPAVNVVIAIVLSIVGVLSGGFNIDPQALESWSFGALLPQLVAINLFLVGFNLLPAFPMDGGRILRALLGFFVSHNQATQVASRVGQGMALIFCVAALLLQHPMLFLIALFVWLAATAESQVLDVEATLQDVPVESIMMTEFATLEPDSPLSDAIALTLKTNQKDFPIMGPMGIVGVLDQRCLLENLARFGAQHKVGEVMNREVPTAVHGSSALELIQRLAGRPAAITAVTSGNQLIGIVSDDNLREFLAIHRALDGWQQIAREALPLPSLKGRPDRFSP